MKRREKREKRRMLLPVLLTLFVSLVLIFSIYFFFWRTIPKDELSEYIRKKQFIIFDENFYEEEKYDITYRWLSKDGTITLVIPYDQAIKIDFVSWSYNTPRNVEIKLDDYLLTELNLTKERSTYTSPFICLKSGVYELKFLVSEDCQVPALIEDSDDTRCLGVTVGDFKKIEAINLAPYIDAQGWHDLEPYHGKDMRWVEENGIIKLINLEEGDYVLEFFTFSFYFDRELNVYVDEKSVHSSMVTPDGTNVEVNLSLQSGLHAIKLDAGGCDYPVKLGVSADPRCLSIAIINPIIYELD